MIAALAMPPGDVMIALAVIFVAAVTLVGLYLLGRTLGGGTGPVVQAVSMVLIALLVGHVVLMIRFPGVQAGRRAAIVQPADLMPTVLDLAGLPIPDARQGRSLAEMITGSASTGRDVAVSGVGFDLASTGRDKINFTVQDERWCLIAWPDRSQWELYDKGVDRSEDHNLISDCPREAERLHRALLDFLASHEAHPALVRLIEAGEAGDLGDYQHRPTYLANFRPYWVLALDAELHG